MMETINANYLDNEKFLEVIDRVPLVSLDLIINDSQNRILMGKRTNAPAKGKWFVPGGRIYKNETLDCAFERICLAEIGIRHSLNQAKLVGAFTHIYNTNIFEAQGVSTHYVVLGYQFNMDTKISLEKNEQHAHFKWFSKNDIDEDIHENSLEYFNYS